MDVRVELADVAVLFGEGKGERFGEYTRVVDGERVAIAAPGVGAGLPEQGLLLHYRGAKK